MVTYSTESSRTQLFRFTQVSFKLWFQRVYLFLKLFWKTNNNFLCHLIKYVIKIQKLKKNAEHLEAVQRRASKMIKGMRNETQEKYNLLRWFYFDRAESSFEVWGDDSIHVLLTRTWTLCSAVNYIAMSSNVHSWDNENLVMKIFIMILISFLFPATDFKFH